MIALLSILAQAAAVDPDVWKVIWGPIMQAGMGAVLLAPIVFWFAMRLEKIMTKLTEAIERNTISSMIAVLNTRHLDEALAELAEHKKREAEDALKK